MTPFEKPRARVVARRYGRWRFAELFEQDFVRVDGQAREVVRANEGLYVPETWSGVYEVPVGHVSTVMYFGWCADDNEHELTDTALVNFRIWPRTSGLLGTI